MSVQPKLRGAKVIARADVLPQPGAGAPPQPKSLPPASLENCTSKIDSSLFSLASVKLSL